MPSGGVFSGSVNLKYVKLGYQYLVNHFLTLLLVPVMVATALELARLGPGELLSLWRSLELDLVHILCSAFLVVFVGTVYVMSRPRPVYLVDYACYKPPASCRVPFATFMEHTRLITDDEKSVRFQTRILERSGLGEDTCLPPANHYIPPNPSMEASRAEAQLVIFSAIDDLVHPNSNALVVSTEIITPNFYQGSRRDMLLPNCLFRMGAAAILLSNRRREARRAKYRLVHVVRTHKGADDRAYRCVYQEEDHQGFSGISLSKELMAIAGDALKSNITTIGPLVLPMSEQLLFFFRLVGRKLINKSWKPYIPDFKLAFEHFCIHAGGRAVIDELQKNLQLSARHVEASRMTLHRFGNTSSSSLWYELAYIEAKGRMRRGDRVWQIGFGSGFKCNSAVWKCLRSIKTPTDGPWDDCVDRYPVDIPEVVKL
ncbi:3-ketoacyl-CoA synthase 5 [Dichanthelium oligosanthes]|uniref:3-ketoacyl-CoA synthase n=1 Tax=Dichanthelium oligosanthes TaxID=888268 RepID=A0A1E5WE63_9POAL|nr:3-ketoacyl-CoA synthase 5 [Dichanthelium oligosanthes]